MTLAWRCASGSSDDPSWAWDVSPDECLNISRAGSVKNHNLRIADGRRCGKSVFLRCSSA